MSILIGESKMNDKKKSWSKSVEKNGYTKSVKVREAENGYIIEFSEWGNITNEKGEDKYVDKRKEIISKTNPLEEKNSEEDKNKLDIMEDFLKDDFEMLEI